MDHRVLEEQLREAACEGDKDRLCSLLLRGVDVNSQNKINGWTCLHWASKRNYVDIVSYLLTQGANKDILTVKGEKASDLADNSRIIQLLGGQQRPGGSGETLPITPNYMLHPKFPYTDLNSKVPMASNGNPTTGTLINVSTPCEELVLKVRVAHAAETDFIEIELEMANRTFDNLMAVMCRELEVDETLVHKIRKLPDTIIRKDKDIQRLKDFQELELVLTTKAMSASTRNYAGLTSVPQPKDLNNAVILY